MNINDVEKAVEELKNSGYKEVTFKDVLDIALCSMTNVEIVSEVLAEAGIEIKEDKTDNETIDWSSPLANVDVFNNAQKENREEEQIYRQYIKDISMFEVLTPERENELLLKAAAGSKYAKETIINSNLRLVVYNAQKYRNRGIPILDLIQEGNIGLMTAVEKFDYKKGFRFTTYATWWILQKIRRAVMEKSGMIRIPAYLIVQLKNINRAKKELADKGQDDTSVENIAQITGYSKQTIINLGKLPYCNISLNNPLSDDSTDTLAHIIPDNSQMSVEDITQELFMKDEVTKSLDVLTSKERDIIMLYYGLYKDGVSHSLQSIGAKYGLTRERIRQIKELAIQKLKLNRALRDLIA